MSRPRKEKRFTGITHDLIEALGASDLSSTEFRVLLILFRETYGEPDLANRERQLTEAPFSPSEVAERTGLNEREVRRALKDLVKRNIVLCVERAQGSRPGIYGPQPKPESWEQRKLPGEKSGGTHPGKAGGQVPGKGEPSGGQVPGKAGGTSPGKQSNTEALVNGCSPRQIPRLAGGQVPGKAGGTSPGCTIIDDLRHRHDPPLPPKGDPPEFEDLDQTTEDWLASQDRSLAAMAHRDLVGVEGVPLRPKEQRGLEVFLGGSGTDEQKLAWLREGIASVRRTVLAREKIYGTRSGEALQRAQEARIRAEEESQPGPYVERYPIDDDEEYDPEVHG